VPKWNIRTFTGEGRTKPVDRWLQSLPPRAAARVIWTIDLLEEHGTDLTMPYARHLQDGIWELRAQLGTDIWRVLYFHWRARTFGLLHGLTKKTQRTARIDINTAVERRAIWLARAERRGQNPRRR